MLQKLLSPIVEVRREEASTLLLMFLYSFLAMTAYNIVQPITRSEFISAHGAENLPYVLLVSVFFIGLLMQAYGRLGSLLPGRWLVPATQLAMAALLVAFWQLFSEERGWVAAAFYWFGQIYGILLISQFWTLANLIFDPRQAKRLFGFIGAGSSLGGLVGGSITAFFVEALGTRNLVLASAAVLTLCATIVVTIVTRADQTELRGLERAAEERGVGGRKAFRMLRESRHLQIIAVVIALTSVGAGIIDQQLSMATEAFKGREATDAMTAVLGQVQVYTSAIGFIIQIGLTTRIQRNLGVGFALMLLPLGLGSTALVILLNGVLWAPMLARVMDKSIRYTVDKTSREILFLPLPPGIKHTAKPFVDVTIDRFGRALSALLLLVLIEPWGLHLDWQRISYASLIVMAFWLVMAVVAKRGYMRAFRTSLDQQDMRAADVRLSVADLSTVEALVEELAHPDEARALYAIDLLESLDKRHLVTPLLLHHDAPAVRVRALGAMGAQRPEIVERWAPAIERLLRDDSPEVRAAAVAAIASIRRADTAGVVRPMLEDPDPRIVATAAIALAGTGRDEDVRDAERVLTAVVEDRATTATAARRDVAIAMRVLPNPRLHGLLLPLLGDRDPSVAREALRTVTEIGGHDFLFVPTLIALLRHRRLKSDARAALVSYGEPVLDALAHFLRDPEEDLWVRRHLPATIARIPCQRALDVLVGALDERDGFLRYKVVSAIGRLRRERPDLTMAREPVERLALSEARRYFTYLTLHHNLFVRAGLPHDTLLALALEQKTARARDRIYHLLGLLQPWKDIAAARWAIERDDPRARASALEYLDNVLSGALRKRLMPVLDDAPLDEKVRRALVTLRSRPRNEEETLLELINDEDEVISASAIDLARARRVWALEADIEHVLAHRDVNDWHVFEAASWALAERRMPEERRRQLWLEPLPATVIADRLRHLPLFASVAVDELFRMAAAGRQARYEAGRVLVQAGVVPDAAQFLLDGRAEIGEGDEARLVDSPAALEFEDLLEGQPAASLIRATDVAVTLTLTADELRTLFADNTDLVEGLFRTIVCGWSDDERQLVTRRSGDESAPLPASGELSPIDKVLALRHVGIFSRVGADEMLQLASIARPTPLEPGDSLAAAGDPPGLWVVLSGGISLASARGERALAAGAGDAVGLVATLAGTPLDWRVDVTHRGDALRIERDDLFDLLGQRPTLLEQLFGALFRN